MSCASGRQALPRDGKRCASWQCHSRRCPRRLQESVQITVTSAARLSYRGRKRIVQGARMRTPHHPEEWRPSMEPVTLLLYVIVAVFLGFVILPLLKRLLQHLLPIILQRCQTAITWPTGGVRKAFRWAWNFLSNQGTLPPAMALSQQVGALIIMSAAVVFGASDLLFTYATLGP